MCVYIYLWYGVIEDLSYFLNSFSKTGSSTKAEVKMLCLIHFLGEKP